MLELRPYQQEAVESVYQYLREHDDNPCVVIPTGGGKTPVIATLCKDAVGRWGGRVIILAHVRELLQQTLEKMELVCPEIRVGVYSAGLKRREKGQPVILAGIQSVYKRPEEMGHFDLAIVDEAHMIPPEGDGMYRTFLEAAKKLNPLLRVIGLTATPYRMETGHVCAPENVLNAVCYEVGVRELIRDGYLSPLVSKAARSEVDTSGLHVQAGEFVPQETEELVDTPRHVEAACREIVEHMRDRKACLVFAVGLEHASHVAEVLRVRAQTEVRTIFGETPSKERDEAIAAFRDGKLKYLVNVNVLTTGFDAPNVDCVAMLRPTMSPGLYYQMVGRGFRLAGGKKDCLILDFGGNILRHGPVDAIRIGETPVDALPRSPWKKCPACFSVVSSSYSACPSCGQPFSKKEMERKENEREAAEEDVLSGEARTAVYEVEGETYNVHTKRGAKPDAPKTMRVIYRTGFESYQSEWVCFEHRGYAGAKAVLWWRRRSNAPTPTSVAQAVAMARAGALCPTLSITVRHAAGDGYDKVVGHELDEKPPWDAGAEAPGALDEIPF